MPRLNSDQELELEVPPTKLTDFLFRQPLLVSGTDFARRLASDKLIRDRRCAEARGGLVSAFEAVWLHRELARERLEGCV